MDKKIHLHVIRSEDCFACRQCCHFSPEESSHAPLFTEEQCRRIHEQFPAEDVRFAPHDRMWRVTLRGQPGSDKLVCPLLDGETARCRIYAYGIFVCDTYPYKITERDGRLLLALSPSCPVVSERLPAMRARAEQLWPRMLEWVRRYPEEVTPWYDGLIVLVDVGPDELTASRDLSPSRRGRR